MERVEPAESPRAGEFELPPPIALRGAESLRQLRSHVRKAVQELARLREENGALQKRILELERGTPADESKSVITFDERGTELRERVDGFIGAIDAYLSRHAE